MYKWEKWLEPLNLSCRPAVRALITSTVLTRRHRLREEQEMNAVPTLHSSARIRIRIPRLARAFLLFLFLMPGFFLSLFFTEGHHKFRRFSRTKEISQLILASSRGPRGGTCWWWPVHRHPFPFSSPSIYSSKPSQLHRPQHRDAAGVLCDWHSFENHLLAVNILCEVISVLVVSLGYSSL